MQEKVKERKRILQKAAPPKKEQKPVAAYRRVALPRREQKPVAAYRKPQKQQSTYPKKEIRPKKTNQDVFKKLRGISKQK